MALGPGPDSLKYVSASGGFLPTSRGAGGWAKESAPMVQRVDRVASEHSTL